MKQAVAIAGAGCVLPSGWGVESFWAAATEGRSAITALNARRFSSERVVAFGQIQDQDHQRSRQDLAQNLQRYCTCGSDLGCQRGTSGVGRSRPGR